MKLERTCFYLFFLRATFWLATNIAGTTVEESGASREFDFTYSVTVPRLPKNSQDL
jgi:hypothetical protein